MEELEPVDALFTRRFGTYQHKYTVRDLVLYALGVGASEEDLSFVFEQHPSFAALPSFGVIPAHPAVFSLPLQKHIPGFKWANSLHGEQYLELLAPLPPAGATLVTRLQLVDIQDKGKGAVCVSRTITSWEGRDLAINEFVSFVLKTGHFRGASAPLARSPAATAANEPPSRPPDAVIEQATDSTQAALYRLSGDLNPLHIDPEFARRVGFERPILHGLCTFGFSCRLIMQYFTRGDPSSIKSVKARFAKHVFPGETLQVVMWVTGPDTVTFQTRVIERDVVAISNAAVHFQPGKLDRSKIEPACTISKL